MNGSRPTKDAIFRPADKWILGVVVAREGTMSRQTAAKRKIKQLAGFRRG